MFVYYPKNSSVAVELVAATKDDEKAVLAILALFLDGGEMIIAPNDGSPPVKYSLGFPAVRIK